MNDMEGASGHEVYNRWHREIPSAWTAIATRPRTIVGRNGYLIWTPVDDAPIDVSAAHRLAADGLLIMANRHKNNIVELVVRVSRRANAPE